MADQIVVDLGNVMGAPGPKGDPGNSYVERYPIEIINGGTSARNADDACVNLGALRVSGDTMKGVLNFNGGNSITINSPTVTAENSPAMCFSIGNPDDGAQYKNFILYKRNGVASNGHDLILNTGEQLVLSTAQAGLNQYLQTTGKASDANTDIIISANGDVKVMNTGNANTAVFPRKSGTVALTSDIPEVPTIPPIPVVEAISNAEIDASLGW